MLQPTPVLLALLLTGTAVAQPYPLARVPQKRGVTLPATPEAPGPEVYVAPGFLTTLVFDGLLERASVELEGRQSRFKRVDAGDSTLNLEPAAELAPGERLGLRVRFKDGVVALLVLTSHPTQVDDQLDVARPRTVEALQALLAQKEAQLASLQARCGEGGPLELIRARQVDESGVKAELVRLEGRRGRMAVDGRVYRARDWAVVDVVLSNPAAGKTFSPGEVRLMDETGRMVKRLLVRWERPRLAPGESNRLLVQTERPDWTRGTEFRLEVLDASGGPALLLSTVNL